VTPKTAPAGARNGVIVERVGRSTRLHAFLETKTLVDAFVGEGRAWLRVLGHGLAVKDTTKEHLTTKERAGQVQILNLGRFAVRLLGPLTPVPGIDSETARRVFTLCARYAKDVVAYCKCPYDEVTLEQALEWVAASGRAWELGEVPLAAALHHAAAEQRPS